MTDDRLPRVHHIDFVVRDLDRATETYRKILGKEPRARESLPDRGVELVRFDLGGVWVILVQPVRADSPVQAFLDRYGEGFFHIAYQVASVEAQVERLRAQGITAANEKPRRGVEGWKLVDLEIEDTAGVLTQFIEQADA